MISIISTCSERLSENEFVSPLVRIAKKFGPVEVTSYKDGLIKADAYIISGTALADFDYENYVENFSDLKEKNVLGICAGYQIMMSLFGELLSEKKYIGVAQTDIGKAYFLFSKIVERPINFTTLATAEFPFGKIPVYVKHKRRNIFATAFHPEVYNVEIIENFLRKYAEGRI